MFVDDRDPFLASSCGGIYLVVFHFFAGLLLLRGTHICVMFLFVQCGFFDAELAQ